jgi:hypothetical protein
MRVVTTFCGLLIGGLASVFLIPIALLVPFRPTHLIVVAVAAGFLASATVALRGGSLWFLRAAWLALVIGFFWSDPPAGLFEGDIITLPLMLLILVGFISSLFARRARPDKEGAGQHG